MARTALLAIAATALLAACKTVGPDFATPAAPSDAGYAMAGDPAARLPLDPAARTAGPWWTAFGSPALDQAIREALVGSPTLAEARATLEKAQAQEAAARGANLPEANLTAGAQRQRINTSTFGFAGFPSPTLSLYSVGAGVSYDLDLFGGGRRSVEAAAARTEAAARQADAAYLSLTGEMAMQAVAIAGLKARIATVEAILADDRRVVEMVDAAERAGGEAPSAKTGARAQLAADEALLPPLERALAQARHRMALLAGKTPAGWTAPDFDLAGFTRPSALPVELPSTLVRRRPDILAAEAQLHAATAAVGVAVADQYPDIRLSANLTQTALQPGDLFSYDASGWNLLSGLAAPLYDGGRRKAARAAAEAEARASLARYQATVLRAFTQVADVLSALATDESAIGALTRAEEAAQNNFADEQAAYRLGAGTVLRVVDAQRQLSRARLARVAAEAQMYADLVELYAAMAGEWRDKAPT